MSDFLNDVLAGDRTAIIQLAALYCVVMGVWSVGYCLRLRRWPSVVGSLETAGLQKFGWDNSPSDQMYSADVRYAYEVDGERHVGSRLSPSFMLVSANARALLRWQLRGIERVGDDQVRVFYNPSKPRKSFLIVPPNGTIAAVAAVTFGGATLLLWAI